MSSERLSRALIEVGDGLGQLAGYHTLKEREAAAQMREESLQRLRGQQQTEDRKFRAEQNQLDRDQRAELQKTENQMRLDIESKRTAHQDRRLNQQRWDSVEASSQAAMKGLDKQISDMRRDLDKVELEAIAGVNEDVKQRMLAQIDALEDQKRLTAFQSGVQLRELGDPRYQNKSDDQLLIDAGYSAEEVEAFMKDAAGGVQSEDGATPTEEASAQPAAPPAASSPPVQEPSSAYQQGQQSATAVRDFMIEEMTAPGGVPGDPMNRAARGVARRLMAPGVVDFTRGALGLDPVERAKELMAAE